MRHLVRQLVCLVQGHKCATVMVVKQHKQASIMDYGSHTWQSCTDITGYLV